jgi:hypothetical protein
MTESERKSETLEQFIERASHANFRFAVGNPSRGFSTTWTAFGNRSDYYIGSRSFMGSQKISLHASGICRVALTNRQFDELAAEGLTQPADRAIVKWRRADTPQAGAQHVASVIFPTDYLGVIEQPRGSYRKPLFIFDAAPAGQAVEFGFFFSREEQSAIREQYLKIGQPIVCTTLESGEHVTVVAKISEFDKAYLPSQAQLDKASGTVFSRSALDNRDELPNLTATFWNDPRDGDALRLVEVGGVTLRRTPSRHQSCEVQEVSAD